MLYITNDTNDIFVMGECNLYKGVGVGLATKDKRAPSILKVVQTVGWIFALTNIKNCKN